MPPIERSVSLVLAGIALATATLPAGCGRGPAPSRPNLVFISIDTLRADHLGCYGYPRPTSPVLDAFAARSHRFSRAYCSMPTTLPSHAAMFTGFHPAQLGVTSNRGRLPDQAQTLAEVLAAQGYQTGAFISSVALDASRGLAQGFGVYDDGEMTRGQRVGANAVALAERWIESVQAGPFFAFVHLYDPHTPYHAPEPQRRSLQAPDRAEPRIRGFRPPDQMPSAEQVAAIVAAYDAEIAYADACIGSLLRRLDELERTQDTIVVVVSDHGETLGELLTTESYAFDHGEFLAAHQLHVPLMISVPSIPGSSVIDSPLSTVDLFATLLDLLDVPKGAEVPARSFAPLLRGVDGDDTPVSPVVSQRRSFEKPPRPKLAGSSRSLIEGRWQVTTMSGRLADTLIDLESDPLGLVDVASRNPHVVAALHARLWKLEPWLAPLYAPETSPVDPALEESLRELGYVR
jgi:arylsulfatase